MTGPARHAAGARPRVLFFARGYQASLYPQLTDPRYEAVFATLTRAEAAQLRAGGTTVAACFEEDFDRLEPAAVPEDYLATSFVADRFLGRYPHRDRLVILGKEIAFWRELFDRYAPVAAVNELVAIEIAEVLCLEARARGVAYLAPMVSPIDGHFYFLPDPLSLSGRHLDLPEPDARAREMADRYFEQVQAPDYRPDYVRRLRGRHHPKAIAAAIGKAALWRWRDWRSRDITRSGAFRYESYSEEFSKRLQVFAAGLFARYDTFADLDPAAEAVMYPLHVEPEATLNYNSEFVSNQVATIENVLKCLTTRQALVVKEHPADKGALLRPKFRRLRGQYSNLVFLPAEISGREVLARCERIVTLTSTVGWEGALLGKRVCVMGDIFWDSVPGIVRVETWPQLRAMMHRPLSQLPQVGIADARRLIGGMAAISHRGRPLPHPDRDTRGNLQDLCDAIAKEAGIDARQPVPAH